MSASLPLNSPSWNKAEFESRLNAFIEKEVPEPRLREIVLYALHTGGKRLRPRIIAESRPLVSGLTEDETYGLGIAIECVHTFSLIHDDLPCMDNDDTRRGQPTVHKKYTETDALLAGDILFSLAPLALKEEKPRFALSTAQNLSYCATAMIRGQHDETDMTRSWSKDRLKTTQHLKTGMLFEFAFSAGARWVYGPQHPVTQQLAQLGQGFGLAFQIFDDLEDIEQDGSSPKNWLNHFSRQEAKIMATRVLTHPFSDHFLTVQELRSRIEKLNPIP